MLAFPNCKINLGLRVTEKRTDGFHNLDTVFYPVHLFDALEFVQSNETKLSLSGNPIPGHADQNIVLRAYHLLKQHAPGIPPLHIHLLKKIPTGGGLGGGSSNGAMMLRMLNDHIKLNLEKQQLLDLALTLGSDCPFFLYNQACHASGRGELLSPVSIDLTGYALMLALPGIHVSTAAAFSEMKPAQHNHSTKDIIVLPVSEWKHHLFNDFEQTVFAIHPVLGELKQSLYDAGAIYCSMSGSGSTLYALVDRHILNEFKERIKQDPRFDHLETYYT